MSCGHQDKNYWVKESKEKGTHAWNSSTRETEAEGFPEFKASLRYVAKPCLKKKKLEKPHLAEYVCVLDVDVEINNDINYLWS